MTPRARMAPRAGRRFADETTPTPPTTTAGSGDTLAKDTIAALQAGLEAEHAALWAYGLVTAHDPAAADSVTTMVGSHQNARDVITNLIVHGGATPVGPAPAYQVPHPVTNAATAIDLALTIESNCARAWSSIIGHTDDSTLRGTALSALSDCAMRMVTWREAAKDSIVTVPFPGDPSADQ